jgi:hypothetical protein
MAKAQHWRKGQSKGKRLTPWSFRRLSSRYLALWSYR